MKTQFTPIAMRCTEEQFKAIEPKLKEHNIKNKDVVFNLESYPYLTNFYSQEPYCLGSTKKSTHRGEETRWLECWDEDIFLKACGIEVNTYTVSKEFILEGYNAACSTWKAKIEAQFPELFPKLEVGRWLKDDTNQKWLMYRDVKNIYGFDTLGNWFYRENESYEPNSCDRYATDKEVETALIAEAKRRGFNKTTMITQTFNENQEMCIGFWDESSVKFERNKLFAKGVRIFDNGKWAEIISDPIEVTLEQIADKFNVNVEQLKIKK